MKLLIWLLTLYVGLVKCDEGCILHTEPVQDWDTAWLKGKTSYTIFAYKNSNEKNVTCTSNSVDEDYNVKKTHFYSNGKSKVVKGKIEVDKMCKCNPGRIITSWPSPLIKYVVYFDDDFRIAVACFDGVGN